MNETQKNNLDTHLPVSAGSQKIPVVHPTSPVLTIGKTDLILYLLDFKKSIQNRQREGLLVSLAKTIFILSIFFTSDFKSFGDISGSAIRSVYLVFSAVIIYDFIVKVSKKDDSKYKTADPEYMALMIEDNCEKKK